MTTLVKNGTETNSVAGILSADSELARYFVASGIAFLVDVGTLHLLTQVAGIHYLFSAATGFFLGLCTIYFLSIRWVFSKRSVKNTHHELLLFSMIGIGGLGINELGIYLLTDKLMFHYLVSKMLVTIFVFAWNFGIRKLILFR